MSSLHIAKAGFPPAPFNRLDLHTLIGISRHESTSPNDDGRDVYNYLSIGISRIKRVRTLSIQTGSKEPCIYMRKV